MGGHSFQIAEREKKFGKVNENLWSVCVTESIYILHKNRKYQNKDNSKIRIKRGNSYRKTKRSSDERHKYTYIYPLLIEKDM